MILKLKVPWRKFCIELREDTVFAGLFGNDFIRKQVFQPRIDSYRVGIRLLVTIVYDVFPDNDVQLHRK